MLKRAIEDFKGLKYIEKEHSKADMHYIRKLQESLREDLMYTMTSFYSERNMLQKRVTIAEELHIEDKFLLTKCNELLEELNKTAKKLSKYNDNKGIKCVKFRDMYNAYALISETNRAISITKNYISQLNRYTNIE